MQDTQVLWRNFSTRHGMKPNRQTRLQGKLSTGRDRRARNVKLTRSVTAEDNAGKHLNAVYAQTCEFDLLGSACFSDVEGAHVL
jgi:hypothetical protein